MASKRTLAQRLFNISKKSNTVLTNWLWIPRSSAKLAPDPGDDAVFRRFFQWRPIYQSASTAPGLRPLPMGENLLEKLRVTDIARDRIRLDGLIPPPPPRKSSEKMTEGMLTPEDARKVLRVSQLETVKSRLRQVTKDRISFAEFVQICTDGWSNVEQGLEFAKMLDDSGTVIVLGNVVFLRPDQVVKVIQGLIPESTVQPDDRWWKELEKMEEQKAAIDRRAEYLVRRELWFGLGYLVIQTAAFMRLTFWELSWDVMEPICFYVTSVYFMAGYTFFLRTSKEPSFEGFFQSRLSAKQNRLMKIDGFDVGRYCELRRACYPRSSASGNALSFAPSFDHSERTENTVALRPTNAR